MRTIKPNQSIEKPTINELNSFDSMKKESQALGSKKQTPGWYKHEKSTPGWYLREQNG